MSDSYPLHQAVSNLLPSAIRAGIAAGHSPYNTDVQGYTAWDCLSSDGVIAGYVGASTPSSATLVDALEAMALVAPQTIQERRMGDLAYESASAYAQEQSVILDLVLQRASSEQVSVDPDALSRLNALQRGSAAIAAVLAARAPNPSLPDPDPADLMDVQNARHASALKADSRARSLVEGAFVDQGRLMIPNVDKSGASVDLQDALRSRRGEAEVFASRPPSI